MSEKKLFVFCDHVGRVVAGQLVSETTESVTLAKPTIISVELVQGTGQQTQLKTDCIPYIFPNLLSPASSDEWTFNRSQIVESNVTLVESLENHILGVQATQPEQTKGKVINLFD